MNISFISTKDSLLAAYVYIYRKWLKKWGKLPNGLFGLDTLLKKEIERIIGRKENIMKKIKDIRNI